MAQLLEQLNMHDRMLFATDYPHWDFDAPDRALPPTIGPDLRRAIFGGNALGLFRFGRG
jgi:predicted TIM-barrel fold metal-dependent hydrolase